MRLGGELAGLSLEFGDNPTTRTRRRDIHPRKYLSKQRNQAETLGVVTYVARFVR